MIRKISMLCLLAFVARAEEFSGTVTQVLSGNLLELRTDDDGTYAVRLLATLVPASGSESERSRKNLEALVLNREVTFEWERAIGCKPNLECVKVGKILLHRKDINLTQIVRGFAQHDPSAQPMQCTSDRALYREAEDEARRKKVGLWATGTFP